MVSIFILAPGFSIYRSKDANIRDFYKGVYISNTLALLAYLLIIVPKYVHISFL